MDEKIQALLDETVVTLEFALKDVNVLLNALNAPFGTPTVVYASFINAIQQQAGPQAEKARTAIETAAKGEDKTDEPAPAA
jgi:hypothetical protein